MDTSPSDKINILIDRLFNYREDHDLIVGHLISIGKDAIPELLAAVHERQFRHAQNAVDSKENVFRHIAKALVGIVENEKEYLLKDQISLQIVNEMAIHVKWQIEITLSSREDFELYKKAFDDNLFNKACESALAMGQLKDSRALPYLFEVIKNKYSHPSIRENALIALGQIGDEKAMPHLLEIIDQHDYNTHFAIKALVTMGSITAVPPLLDRLEHISGLDADDTRANIIWALGQLRDPRAVSKLIEWVKTHKNDMRAVAIRSLGNIGSSLAIPILEACLDDITILNRQDWGGTFWIFRTFRDKRVCDFAFESLQQIGTPEALNIIMKWQPPVA